jgi:hypothetical protein
MTEPRIGQRPWWADETLTKHAHDQGYAAGSDYRLASCHHAIAKHLSAPVADHLIVARIRAEVRVWASELDQRGLL